MVDEMNSAAEPAGPVCPWCSAGYTGEPETCPSCGAALTVDPTTDTALPGLTAIDAAAIVRAKAPVPKPRSRLLSWISGEYPDDAPTPVETGALRPPDADVRREMLRLELEAEVADLQAEVDAMAAEAAAEERPFGGEAAAPPGEPAAPEPADAGPGSGDVDASTTTADPLSDGDRQPA